MNKSTLKNFHYATGAMIRPDDLEFHEQNRICITDAGADTSKDAVQNTRVINTALRQASELPGGGMVVVPAGVFQVYTIFLQNNVTLYLSEGAVLQAAKPKTQGNTPLANYAEPEVNIYAGLQGTGHSFLRNALIYGEGLHNVAITGPGLLDGSNFHADTGTYENILRRSDPTESGDRFQNGDRGEWYGNKGIALKRCDNIVLQDFSIIHGGHFGMIVCAVNNLYVDHVLVDTNRDAFDIDCCSGVTVVNSTFNSLCDDGICLKSDYAVGEYLPCTNVYIENCTVCGFDPGSVYAGTWTRNRVIAPDRCGPTGRVKFGTESSCGYDTVIIRKVHFIRSRGFCMEAVDTSPMHDVLMEDCLMEEISSAPVFIRVGDRGRFGITGVHKDSKIPCGGGDDVRLDNPSWVIPSDRTGRLHSFPAQRYTPSYRRDHEVSLDGLRECGREQTGNIMPAGEYASEFQIVDPARPCRTNLNNYAKVNGEYYALRWNDRAQKYEPDLKQKLSEQELKLYANAVGRRDYASAWNIEIRNITIRNCDPRYPIVIHGIEESRIRDLFIHDISVEFRGGMTRRMAVEQRQLNTVWNFREFEAPVRYQILPWQVNSFFCQNEALLPRISWNKEREKWEDDLYNVPEMPDVYPESSNWGILPAYGIYARHVENVRLENISIMTDVPDERACVVLDDARRIVIRNITVSQGDGKMTAFMYGSASDHACSEDYATLVNKNKLGIIGNKDQKTKAAVGTLVLISDPFRRKTGLEYVPEEKYLSTQVSDVDTDGSLKIEKIQLNSPAPGTPPDSLYPYPTAPDKAYPYTYAVPIVEEELPRMVYRPFAQIDVLCEEASGRGGAQSNNASERRRKGPWKIRRKEKQRIAVRVLDPASDDGRGLLRENDAEFLKTEGNWGSNKAFRGGCVSTKDAREVALHAKELVDAVMPSQNKCVAVQNADIQTRMYLEQDRKKILLIETMDREFTFPLQIPDGIVAGEAHLVAEIDDGIRLEIFQEALELS